MIFKVHLTTEELAVVERALREYSEKAKLVRERIEARTVLYYLSRIRKEAR